MRKRKRPTMKTLTSFTKISYKVETRNHYLDIYDKLLESSPH